MFGRWLKYVSWLIFLLIGSCVVTEPYQRPRLDHPISSSLDVDRLVSVETAPTNSSVFLYKSSSSSLENLGSWSHDNRFWLAAWMGNVSSSNALLSINNGRRSDLLEFIVDTQRNNNDLKIAKVNLSKQLEMLGLTQAQSNVGLSAGVDRKWTRSSGQTKNAYDTSIKLSYDFDVWGRLSDDEKAALATVDAVQEDLRLTKLMMVSSVVKTYWAIATDRAILQLQDDLLINQKKQFDLIKIRQQLGMLTLSDVEAASVRYQQSLLEKNQVTQRLRSYERVLAGLLNQPVDTRFDIEPIQISEIEYAPMMPAHLSSDLILNRPDVVAAEHRLKASFYQVSAAKKQWMPSFSLTAALGTASQELAGVLKNPIQTLGAGLSLPFLQWGAIKQSIRVSELTYEANVENFRRVVQQAYRDTFDVLDQLELSKQALRTQNNAMLSILNLDRQSKLKYQLGVLSELEQLEAQQTLITQKILLLQARQVVLEDFSSIYEVFGGAAIDVIKENQ